MTAPEHELGASATNDALLVALNSYLRTRAGGGRAEQRVTAIFDAIWLALRRSDDAFLDEVESRAIVYARKRGEDERWGPHESWGDNATKIRSLIHAVTEDLERARTREFEGVKDVWENMATRLRIAVGGAFPALDGSRIRDAERQAIQTRLVDLCKTRGDDVARLVERALVAVGMSSEDAHQRFAFVRVAESRAARARLKKARTRARPR